MLGQAVSQLTERDGDQHPDLLTLKCRQSLVKARLGKLDEAYDLAESGEQFRIYLMTNVMPGLSEGQALNLKQRLENCGGMILALTARARDANANLRAWRLASGARGVVTELQKARIASARNNSNEAEKKRWLRWQSATRAYGTLVLNGSAAAEALRVARSELDLAERDLGSGALRAARFDSGESSLDATIASVRSEDILVDYVKADHFDLDPHANSIHPKDHELYAFIKDRVSTRLIALGDAGPIEAKIDHWHELLQNPRSNLDDIETAGWAVRKAIWDPLKLESAPGYVFVIPDGGLFRINFSALPDGDGFLVEHGWRIHLLDSERDLALPEIEKKTAANALGQCA